LVVARYNLPLLRNQNERNNYVNQIQAMASEGGSEAWPGMESLAEKGSHDTD
jgi:hypothetical protein